MYGEGTKLCFVLFSAHLVHIKHLLTMKGWGNVLGTVDIVFQVCLFCFLFLGYFASL